MQCSLSTTSLGSIQFKKLMAYNPGEPERRASQFSTLDGATIHQITEIVETDRIINVPMILTKAKRDILLTLRDSSTLKHNFQDGDEVYEGWFDVVFNGKPHDDFYRYTMKFHVTSKLS